MFYEYDINTNKFNGLEHETVDRKVAEHIFGNGKRIVEFDDDIIQSDTIGTVIVPEPLNNPSEPIFNNEPIIPEPDRTFFTSTSVVDTEVVTNDGETFIEHDIVKVFDEEGYNAAVAEYELDVQRYNDAAEKYETELAEYRNLLTAFEQRELEIEDALSEQKLEVLVYKTVPQELIEVGERIRKTWQEVDIELPSGVTVKMDPEYEKDMLAFASNESNAGKTFYGAENSDGDKISISFDDADFLVASFGVAKDAIMNGVE
jgi:exonuclease VII small subunit